MEDELLILRTTYRDNRFLTEDDRRNYENERDEYFRRVYTLGEGVSSGGDSAKLARGRF